MENLLYILSVEGVVLLLVKMELSYVPPES